MAIEVGSPMNMQKNEILSIVLHNASSHPTYPKAGQIYYNTTDSVVYLCTVAGSPDGTWVTLDTGGGEANTAGNIGTNGIGVYNDKSGVQLRFKKIYAASNKLSVTDNTSDNQVDIDFQPGNVDHDDLSGSGTNTHSQIDTHIADTSGNPHSITASMISAIPTSQKGAVNGVCPLGADSKVAESYLPASVLGAMEYQGSWNASTDTPTIPTADSSNKGHYYIVSVAGSTNVNGINDWGVGDWIISNGSNWDKIDNTDSVTSVAGKTGVVTLDKSDVGLSNVINAIQLQQSNNLSDLSDTETARTNLGLSSAVVSYATSFGNGSATSFTITHSLGTRDVNVSFYDNSSPYESWLFDWRPTTTNAITIETGITPSTNQFRVVIQGTV